MVIDLPDYRGLKLHKSFQPCIEYFRALGHNTADLFDINQCSKLVKREELSLRKMILASISTEV